MTHRALMSTGPVALAPGTSKLVIVPSRRAQISVSYGVGVSVAAGNIPGRIERVSISTRYLPVPAPGASKVVMDPFGELRKPWNVLCSSE